MIGRYSLNTLWRKTCCVCLIQIVTSHCWAFNVETKKYSEVHSFPENSHMVVTFVDFGQGLCQVVQCRDGGKYYGVVADCGGADGGLSKTDGESFLKKLLPDSTSVTLSISHPDEDHFNKLDLLNNKLNLQENVYVGGQKDFKKTLEGKSFDKIYKKSLEAVSGSDKLKLVYANDLQLSCNTAGDQCKAKSFSCGKQYFSILYALDEANKGSNAYSLVLYSAVNSAASILFQGDLIKAQQKKAFEKLKGARMKKVLYTDTSIPDSVIPLPLPSILGAAHHGSKPNDSFDKDWTTWMKPAAVAISVGKNKHHKHPDEDTVNDLANILVQNGSVQPQGKGHYIESFGPVSTSGASNTEEATMLAKVQTLNALWNSPAPMDVSSGPAPTAVSAMRSAPTGPAAPAPSLEPIKPGIFARTVLSESLPIVQDLLATANSQTLDQTGKTLGIMRRHINKIVDSSEKKFGRTLSGYKQQLHKLAADIKNDYKSKAAKNGDWQARWISTNLYTTGSNGSLSYFIDNSGINKLVCYQPIDGGGKKNCQEDLPRITGKKRRRDN